MGLHCFKKHLFQRIFMGIKKKSKETFRWGKNMEDMSLVVFKFLFLFLCVLLFFLLMFSY